jgi:hypothetical protein
MLNQPKTEVKTHWLRKLKHAQHSCATKTKNGAATNFMRNNSKPSRVQNEDVRKIKR